MKAKILLPWLTNSVLKPTILNVCWPPYRNEDRRGKVRRKFGLHVCLVLQVFGFQVDHLFLILFFYWNRLFSTLFLWTWVLSFKKLLSWIGVGNGHLYTIKEGPTWKLNSSKLDTCHGQIFFLPWPTGLHYGIDIIDVCDLHTNNKRLIIDELVEVQDFMKIIDPFKEN